ncbi:bacteriophage pi2 protein 36 [Streptococcus suis]|uniref:phage head closure protein n=1 Tax=Streptococcus suis TaxID=1307 RepID=UPI0005D2B84B|nr:phage head closure protein [Streptococcus suis]MDG3222538.1 phage head closure protein [Streptococcus suis]CYY71361.1 bacteriophage pi2 protein 36 [Streptococcus suis]CYY88864.1 bacteriophage pi2 protein 36 [Streptococcus suis]
MWNHEITLIAKKITGKDKLKQNITEEVKTVLLCRKKSIIRSEFYQANQAGIRPSLVVDIHSFEYDNQELAEFEGKRYRIFKTYPVDLETLELTMTEKLS